MSLTCPVCEKPLMVERPNPLAHWQGVKVWCGYGPCSSHAANEGAEGATPEEVHKQLCLLVERELEQND